MFYNILDKQRRSVLPLLKNFKRDFYLAGGTALALQLGCRDSIDFDFFTEKSFDTGKLFERARWIFSKNKILKIQEEKNTLTILVDEKIKISFFAYNYRLLEKPVVEENLRIASITDIACMKLSAIVSRATNKDYVDIFFILQRKKLAEIMGKLQKKFPEIDPNLVLKSLTYFQDIVKEPIKFRNNNNVPFKKIEKLLKEKVKNYVLREKI
ncbi:nucleotidyl transferase AbiEii/AbiGii toxin family protein [Candidatus Peregrinibacteria bacterium]|nr:nucleotidyl transferase AbiEii/AbiGii toxin family protein [Candidatus Peregrinibacteria bacterium]